MKTIRILTAAGAISLAAMAHSAAAEGEPGLSVPELRRLDTICLSDSRFDRGMCIGYIHALLDVKSGDVSRGDIDCHFGDLLTFRNTAVHGYAEMVELIEWIDEELAAGAEPFPHEEWTIENVRDFMASLERARARLEDRRASGHRPLDCVLIED